MISQRSDVIAAIKETLNPFYKKYGLTHDEFKMIAKNAATKVFASGGATATELRSIVFRCVLDSSQTTNLSNEGFEFLSNAMGLDGERNSDTHSNHGDGARPRHAVAADADLATANEASAAAVAALQRPADERITLDSLKLFMAQARLAADRASGVSGQRRDRNA